MVRNRSKAILRLTLTRFEGGAEEGWLVQQVQYDLAQVRRDRIKLKKLQPA
jgi:hypothetical protein